MANVIRPPISALVRLGDVQMKLNRRMFLVTSGAAAGVRVLPQAAAKSGGKRILTLVFDKSAGAMRAVERVIR